MSTTSETTRPSQLIYCDELLEDGTRCTGGPFLDNRGLAAHKRGKHEFVSCENCGKEFSKNSITSHLRWCVEHNAPTPKYDLDEWKDVGVNELKLHPQTENLLLSTGLNTVAEILKVPKSEFTAIPMFGPDRLADLEGRLAEFELSLLTPVVLPESKATAKKREKQEQQEETTKKEPELTPEAAKLRAEVDATIASVTSPVSALLARLRTEEAEHAARLGNVREEIRRLERVERMLIPQPAPTPRPEDNAPYQPRADGKPRAGEPPLTDVSRLAGHISEERVNRVYDFIKSQATPVTREQVVNACGIGKEHAGHAINILRSAEKIRWVGRGGVSNKASLYSARMEG